MATHKEQVACGFSLYRGVLIQWDEDGDERILEAIDIVPDDLRQYLLVVQGHEGHIEMLWNFRVPPQFVNGKELELSDNDIWTITSKAVMVHLDNLTDSTVSGLY